LLLSSLLQALSENPMRVISAAVCLLSVALAGVFTAGEARAQWVWKDAQGTLQFSDKPPPSSVTDNQIVRRPASAGPRAAATTAASAPAPASDKAAASELEAKMAKADKEKADKLKAREKAEAEKLAAAKQENCRRAQAHLRALDEGMRIAQVNEKGEREFLDDQARANEAARTRSIVASDCSR
jgi:hypothetical protein